MDRHGIQKVVLPAAALYGLSLASFALMTAGAHWEIFVMFACASGFGAACGPLLYSKAITAWFDKERGFALGIATCGVGLGTFVIPVMAQTFIGDFGWRIGYVAVGITTWLISPSAWSRSSCASQPAISSGCARRTTRKPRRAGASSVSAARDRSSARINSGCCSSSS